MYPTPLGTTTSGNLTASYREASERLQTVADAQAGGGAGTWGFVHYRNEDGSTVDGGCADWKDFTLSTLSTDADSIRYVEVRIIQWRLFENDDAPATAQSRAVTCSNATVVDRLAMALMLAENASEVCDDHAQWRVATCATSFAEVSSLCVNCSDPCTCTSADEQDNSAWLPLASCGASASPCETEVVHLSLWTYAPEYVIPQIENASVENVESDSISVRVNLTAPAYVTCLALDENETFTGMDMMLTHATATAVYQASPLQSPAWVSLVGLQPLTAYTVYCGVRDRKGRWAADDAVVSLHRSTACCHQVWVDATSSGALQSALAVNSTSGEVVLSVSNAPVALNVSARFVAGNGTFCQPRWLSEITTEALADVSPSSVLASTVELTTVADTVSFVVHASSAGCVYLGVEPVGVHKDKFDVQFVSADGLRANLTSTDTVAIHAKESDTEPNPPELLSAQFSSTGSSVLVDFDTDTDQGSAIDLTSPFSCVQLLPTVIDGSSCVWASASRVVMTLTSGSSLDVSDTLSLSAGVVKARCTRADGNCSVWSFAAASSTIVKAPSTPIQPSVSLRGGGVWTACTAVEMSVAEAVGSGGRAWSSILWEVSLDDTSMVTPNRTAVASDLEVMLNANASLEEPFQIPVHMFDMDVAYVLTLTVTNFLGASASDSVTVEISEEDALPAVYIDGASSVTVKVAESVSLMARGSVISCGSTSADDDRALTYSWTVLTSTGVDTKLVSSANDSRVLLLPAGTLSVGLYTATVAVYTSSGSTATASVQVVVEGGDVQAVIADRQITSLTVARNVSLNASQSFDEDVPGLTGAAAGLSFLWRCQEMSPRFGRSCGPVADAAASEALVLQYGDLHANREYRFSVLVTASDGRSDSASTEVHVVPSASLAIRGGRMTDTVARSGLAETRVNPGEALSMTVEVEASTAATLAWSLHQGTLANGMSLEDASTTVAVSKEFAAGVLAFPLQLRAGSLLSGVEYVFRLAVTATDGSTAVAGFQVEVNDAPSGGRVVLSHRSIVPLNDTLSASAVAWEDADLPLWYAFSYSARRGSELQWRGLAVLPSVSGTLPEGSATSGYRVTVQVRVEDRWGAPSSATAAVVSRYPSGREQHGNAALRHTMQRSLASADQLQDWDSVLALVGAGAYALQDVNCSLAPNCSALRRGSCADEAHTCGECWDGLVGTPGPANTACQTEDESNGRRQLALHTLGGGDELFPDGAACNADEECRYARCNAAGICSAALLACPGDCSGRGECVYHDYNGVQLSACKVTDIFCRASCVCADGWSGLDCGSTSADMEDAEAVRENMLESLETAMARMEWTVSTIQSACGGLESLTRGTTEWTATFTSTVVRTVATIVAELVDLHPVSVSESDISEPLLRTMSNALPRCVSMADEGECMAELLAALNELIEFLHEYRVTGQETGAFVAGNLRFGLFDAFVQDAGTAMFESPDSVSSSIVDLSAPSIAVTQDALVSVCGLVDSGFGLSSVVFDVNPQSENGSAVESNSTVLRLQAYAASTTSTSSVQDDEVEDFFTVRLPSVVPLESQWENESATFFCGLDGQQSFSLSCHGQPDVMVNCSGRGNGSSVTVECPARRVPSCGVWNGTTFSSEHCEMVDFTESTTTCRCSASSLLCPQVAASGRRSRSRGHSRDTRWRRLDTVAPEPLDMAGIGDLVLQDFVTTWSSADDLTADDVRRSLVVLICLCSFVGIAVAAMLLGWRLDHSQSRKVIPKSVLAALSPMEYQRNMRRARGFARASMAVVQGAASRPREELVDSGDKVDATMPPTETALAMHARERGDAGRRVRGSSKSSSVAPSPEDSASASVSSSAGDSVGDSDKSSGHSETAAPVSASAGSMSRRERESKRRNTDMCISTYVETAFPDVFKRGDDLWVRLWHEVVQRHSWIASVWTYKEHEPRPIRVLTNISTVSALMFVTALMFVVLYPDPGCSDFRTEKQCEEPRSVSNTDEAVCEWLTDEFGRQTCVFVEPNPSLTTILFVVLVTGILTTPFVLLVQSLVQNYIAVETQVAEQDSDSGSEREFASSTGTGNSDGTGLRRHSRSEALSGVDAGDGAAGKKRSKSGSKKSGSSAALARPLQLDWETPSGADGDGAGDADDLVSLSLEGEAEGEAEATGEDEAKQGRAPPRPMLRHARQAGFGQTHKTLHQALDVKPTCSDMVAGWCTTVSRACGFQSSSRSSSNDTHGNAEARKKSRSAYGGTSGWGERAALGRRDSLRERLRKAVKPATARKATSESDPSTVAAHARFAALVYASQETQSSVLVPTLSSPAARTATAAAKSIGYGVETLTPRPMRVEQELSALMYEIAVYTARLEERDTTPMRMHAYQMAWAAETRGSLCMPGTVDDRLVRRLVATREQAEEIALELEDMDDDARGGLLLEYFAMDQLGESARQIFRRNLKLHEHHVKEAPLWKRVAAAAFVVLLNLMFCFYVFLFAVRLGQERQLAWLNALVSSIILDVLVYELIIIAILYVWLPVMIREDVGALMEEVTQSCRELVDDFVAKGRSAASVSVEATAAWRAAPLRYFSPSLRVADRYPHLPTVPVMKWLLRQQVDRAPWSLSGSEVEKDADAVVSAAPLSSVPRVATAAAAAGVAVGAGMSLGVRADRLRWLNAFITLPDLLQDFLLSIVIPLVLFGLVRVHQILYGIHPALVLAPLVGMGLVAYAWSRIASMRSAWLLSRPRSRSRSGSDPASG